MPQPPTPTNGNGHTGRSARGDGRGDALGRGIDATFAVDYVHRIRFTSGVFQPSNTVLREVLEAGDDSTGRAIAFLDAGVAERWPDLPQQVAAYARTHADVLKLAAPVRVVTGGEAAKNDRRVVDAVIEAVEAAGICRHSYVFAIGGGAMLDAVGYGAATAHRGVRLIRFPTTTLAQDDAGIGVKNGINAHGKKNFLGTFAVPWAVINDGAFLATLDDRDWRCGLVEAVKVALLKDAAFFGRIEVDAPRLARRDAAAAAPIIRRSAELHLEHIASGGDPFELLNARPLDFGHWSAHKIEQMSAFRVRHGEAVAIGIAIDVIYSRLIGLLPPADADRIIACLTEVGFVLYDDVLGDGRAVLDGLEEFREHLGGRLTITLLAGIGRAVDAHEIDGRLMREAIEELQTHRLRRAAERRTEAG